MDKKTFKKYLLTCLVCCSGAYSVASYYGIMPVAFDAKGNALILLGRDKHRGGYYDLYAGGRKKNESKTRAAAREFLEESAGLYIPQFSKTLKFDTAVANIESILDKNKSCFIEPNSDRFICPLFVDYIPPNNFLEQIKNPKLRGSFKEKNDFVWVWAHDLYNVLANAKSNSNIWVQTVSPNTHKTTFVPLDRGAVKVLRVPESLNYLNMLATFGRPHFGPHNLKTHP